MRLEMSKRTDLALRAFAHLAWNGDSSGIDLAESIGTTTNYLPQVMKPLVVRGWVQGTPGPGGGYRLSSDLGEITLLELIEVVEGGFEQTQCVLRGAPCPASEPCALHDSWMRARDALLEELASMSVATTLQTAPTKGE